jgi:hypothetical protein
MRNGTSLDAHNGMVDGECFTCKGLKLPKLDAISTHVIARGQPYLCNSTHHTRRAMELCFEPLASEHHLFLDLGLGWSRISVERRVILALRRSQLTL